jgi:hypothetical protein
VLDALQRIISIDELIMCTVYVQVMVDEMTVVCLKALSLFLNKMTKENCVG